ncbi:helix-turn-helix transcriptional regulator [Pseudovibrio sp. Ad26]|uniref:AraC family transcriptional regulator n=1 Tax=Pseudovibrio sp. Ad26 TaxID=989410 RepID=UPI0007B2B1BC|nr:helix-turn-helix transcriptional regulator [Pseudovibrio sp. Ad26]KZL10440.1 HTH-type transcriptional repressor of iron proteins A [Pseudovibrio sp. Ad26]
MTVAVENLTNRSGEVSRIHEVPFREHLPQPLYFRSAQMPKNAIYPRHSHPWGELVYSYSGVMEINLRDGHFLAPPQYAVWLPPDVEHQGLNRQAAVHCSLYVSLDLCGPLPQRTTALEVNPMLRTMLEHLREKEGTCPSNPTHLRFLQVVVDQFAEGQQVGSFLPSTTDPILGQVLQHLQDNPHDNRSLAELARLHDTSERTLIRRCKSDLGIPFAEWKQRLRVLKAMPMLEAGDPVQSIADQLGYGSASSFIAMFGRMIGKTPDGYRKSLLK